jgi:NAD(P)-dependent dehydrogenase (short-subunit alcohol dehydrogenase family)
MRDLEGMVAIVIMTTSGNGLQGQLGDINDVAAMGGIASVTMTLARELAPYGVRVNAIAPLAFSGMTAPLWGGVAVQRSAREERSPVNVAQVVGWLTHVTRPSPARSSASAAVV